MRIGISVVQDSIIRTGKGGFTPIIYHNGTGWIIIAGIL